MSTLQPQSPLGNQFNRHCLLAYKCSFFVESSPSPLLSSSIGNTPALIPPVLAKVVAVSLNSSNLISQTQHHCNLYQSMDVHPQDDPPSREYWSAFTCVLCNSHFTRHVPTMVQWHSLQKNVWSCHCNVLTPEDDRKKVEVVERHVYLIQNQL